MNKREIGTFYEEAVSEYLKLQGIEIICKNFRCRFGEIDLIGRENDCLIFFEVKYRKDERFGYPVEAVTEMKKRTICKCASYYCVKFDVKAPIRYDVIGVIGTQITWIKDAFTHRGYCF